MSKKRFQPFSFSTIFLACMFVIAIALTGCSRPASQAAQPQLPAFITMTDDMGRNIELPREIKKVFFTSPVGAIMTYTLTPEKVVGWNYVLNPSESKYILPQLRSLPTLGGWQGKSTGNIEEIIKADPDVIISMGDLMNETDVSLADKIQQQTGIPVMLVKLPLKEIDKTYTFMGNLLGVPDRAKELATYYKDTLADIQAKAASIPVDKKVSVYYAEGADGLTTEPDGSSHIQTLNIVGGVNVAADVGSAGKAGQTQVSMEQVLAWDPDVIICGSEASGGAYKLIMSNPRWANLKAVKNKQVYEIPSAPYNWFDRPPSVNRIIGFKWVGNLLYPDIYKYDMIKEAKEFYKKFYHYDLTDAEAEAILANSIKK